MTKDGVYTRLRKIRLTNHTNDPDTDQDTANQAG